jgi:hypothetical protein
MADEPASGGFDHDGWRLNQPSDDPRSAQFASAHESHHKQLQDSTSHGALARVYHELAGRTGRADLRELAGRLTAAGRTVHEAFATWLPASALGWSRREVVGAYPDYGRYFDALDALVDSIASPYVRFHAAHAICRCCMQTGIAQTALDAGLERFSLADVRDRDLPDARFAVLRRHPPRWDEAVAALARHAEAEPRLAAAVEAPVLTADLFAVENEDAWNRANAAVYDAVSAALAARGMPSLDLDGHLLVTPGLIAQATRIGGALEIEAGHPRRRSETAGIVLGNIESESFRTAPALRARVLPPGTPPIRLVADVAQPHLFVTLRRTAALMANYRLDPSDAAGLPAADATAAFARRTVVDEDQGKTVELLHLAGPLDPAPDLPVVAVVPMSALRDPAMHAWTREDRLRSCALLADLPLAEHLRLWLTGPGTVFRHVFLRTESFGRVVPFLIGIVEYGDGSHSPLLLRPLSHAGVRIHKAAFAEIFEGSDAIAEDGSFLEQHDRLIELSLAHLAGEEVVFSPNAPR